MPKLILVSFREKMKTPLFSKQFPFLKEKGVMSKKGNYLDPRDVIAARAKNMKFGKGELIDTRRSVPFATIKQNSLQNSLLKKGNYSKGEVS